MKKYKVLEAHQGDKFYQPGDSETGTRIADPNDVGHLVGLGLLEEIGDAGADEAAKAEPTASVADLQAQVIALTQERDDARGNLTTLGDAHQASQTMTSELREQIEKLTTERDGLREQLTAAGTQRDEHTQRITALEGELAAKSSDASDNKSRQRHRA